MGACADSSSQVNDGAIVKPKTYPPGHPPVYELIYFGMNTRADAHRALLKHAKVPFDDKRITGPEWGKIKPTTPCGGAPTLKICADG